MTEQEAKEAVFRLLTATHSKDGKLIDVALNSIRDEDAVIVLASAIQGITYLLSVIADTSGVSFEATLQRLVWGELL